MPMRISPKARKTAPAKARAKTVAEYLAGMTPDKRAVITAARKLVRANIPKGYAEFMNWGVINWGIPLKEFPDTYNGQPLCYIGLGAQKNYNALYLMGCYDTKGSYVESAGPSFLKEEFRKAGKKFDMGKCCLRFKEMEDLEVKAVGRVIGMMTPSQFIDFYKRAKGI